MPEPIAPGDAFTVTAGCDKRFATCRDRFANTVNFRGFPHIPGNDFIVSVPVPGSGRHDGSGIDGWLAGGALPPPCRGGLGASRTVR